MCVENNTDNDIVHIDRLTIRKKNFRALLCCAAGIALNLIFTYIAGLTGYPIYLDTIGTVLSASLGGFLPGIIVGLATNFIKGVSDVSSIYYGVLNVFIALCAASFAKRGMFRKPHKILLSIIVFTLIGGGIGTLVPWFLDGVVFEAETFAAKIYSTGHFSLAVSQLLANLITDFIDKAISMTVVLIIIRFLPDNIKAMFRIADWKQTPLSDDETKAARHISCRNLSIQTKILLVLTAALLAIAVAATSISMVIYRNTAIQDHIKLANGVTNLTAGVLTGKPIDKFIEEGEKAEGYTEIEEMLYSFRESTQDIEYVYVYKIMEDGCHVVFDLDTDEIEGSKPGDVVPFDPTFEEYLPALLAGESIEPVISDDSYGWLLTVYQPVYDKSGNCLCYAAADVSMDQITANERSFLVEMLALFLGFLILIIAIVWELMEYDMILPINSISIRAGAFAYNSEKARESSVEKIKELNIHTGDEVENLYKAIVKTSEDSIKYVADLQEKTEMIARMQKALIMVLADIVESRDKNTGDHVRKTAAYVEIILRQMKKDGMYPELLTEDFIQDVVNSAPLHDIGKITIPDAILNKPGRLDDNEYTIMKNHAKAGSDIIGKAIELVPDSGYLNEARVLAEFHHEKWNGTGYPNGISGEDIPLSARVMAVADVFDALVSKRSYKEPFSIEKAMDIIREGAGTHFDPNVAEAFFRAEPEVRQVSERFEHMNYF